MKSSSLFVNNHLYDVLIAETVEEQERGLMFVDSPVPIMMFPHKYPCYNSFWMKNTCTDLDIIFCCNNTVIDIKRGIAGSCDIIGVNYPYDVVIEMDCGRARKIGLEIGSKFIIK